VTPTALLPCGVELVVSTVKTEVALVVVVLNVTEAGLSVHVMPVPGEPDGGVHPRVTRPLKLLPDAAVTVMVEVPEPPPAAEIAAPPATVNGGATVRFTEPFSTVAPDVPTVPTV
jgi:hypothetical protein